MAGNREQIASSDCHVLIDEAELIHCSPSGDHTIQILQVDLVHHSIVAMKAYNLWHLLEQPEVEEGGCERTYVIVVTEIPTPKCYTEIQYCQYYSVLRG